MGDLLLGIDAGSTVVKAVVVDADGRQRGVGERANATGSPRPHWQERDMAGAWTACAAAIRAAIDDAGVDGGAVAAIGVSGHGDGAYLVDAAGAPVRPAILSTDSRAQAYADASGRGETGERLLETTGQVPFAASPPPLIQWLRDHEPDAYARTAHYLLCKDWLRLCLTGEVATDVTDASGGFVDVQQPRWSHEALELYGLTDFADRLPRLLASTEVAGQVTAAAAEASGLRAGTPVVAGCHDVHAAAVGLGADRDGACSVVMGTWSINQVVSTHPAVDRMWQSRHSIHGGSWLNMSSSPASSNNVDWICRTLGISTADRSTPVWREAMASLAADGTPYFLPYLYGGPYGGDVGGTFAGLHGWHEAPDLLAAVLRGVVFNHRLHLRFLEQAFGSLTRIRAAGGGTRMDEVCQLLADATGAVVEVVAVAEPGAVGVARMAGRSVGAVPAGGDAAVPVRRSFTPDPDQAERLAEQFQHHVDLSASAVALARST